MDADHQKPLTKEEIKSTPSLLATNAARAIYPARAKHERMGSSTAKEKLRRIALHIDREMGTREALGILKQANAVMLENFCTRPELGHLIAWMEMRGSPPDHLSRIWV